MLYCHAISLRQCCKILVVTISLLSVSGCNGKQNLSQKLLTKLEHSINSAHKTTYGKIIAKYNLTSENNKSQCIHLPNYSSIINNPSENKTYIKHITPVTEDFLQRRALAKVSFMTQYLQHLNKKYNILNKTSIDKVLSYIKHMTNAKSKSNSVFDVPHERINHLKSLTKLDMLVNSIPLFFPYDVSSKAKLTSHFGLRKHPIYGTKTMHHGTDFAGHRASAIHASTDGIVSSVSNHSGYGLNVIISHGEYFKTRYAHLSKAFVEVGSHVITGQKIGLQGQSGKATNEHLHFEILFQEQRLNPIDFLRNSYECQNLHNYK